MYYKSALKCLPSVSVVNLHSENRKLSLWYQSLFLNVLQLVSEKDGNLSLQQPLRKDRNKWLILDSNTHIFSEAGSLSRGTMTLTLQKFCSFSCIR